MSIIPFDTHAIVKTLQTKGFQVEQAEGITDALKDALTVAEIATKHDINDLREDMQREINGLRGEINGLREDMQREINGLRGEINGLREDVQRDINGLREDVQRDINGLREDVQRDINGLREDVQRDINGLRMEMQRNSAETKAEMIKWMVSVGVLQTAMIGALLIKLVPG